MYIPILISGFGGGVLRGLVGFIKHQFSYKEVKFNLPYFAFMMILSGVVGLLTIMAVEGSGITFLGREHIPAAIAFIIGYAGGDFLENVYKIILKKPVIFK